MYNIDYMNDSINFSQIAIHLALFRILIIEIQAPVIWQHIIKKDFYSVFDHGLTQPRETTYFAF